ncbi:MAG: ImmA/IrrE family metallo-endopeptidase [Candidatus Bathyarchaeota archaeon]|nr:ImmA/IrrE family metallo-endopeptidase [Candidatus Termitimicrobium sp.]
MGTKNYAHINPAMLKWARTQTPFRSIAEVVNHRPNLFTVEQIEAWENGTEYPTINQAKALAKLYDISFASLYLTIIPKNNLPPFTDRRTIYGYPPRPVSYELWREIRRITANREIALDVAGDYLDEIEKLPTINPDENTLSIAKKIREYLGVTSPFPNKSSYEDNAFKLFRRLFENKGLMVAQLSNVEMSEIRGLSIYNEDIPIIAVNSKDSDRAKVFTLFHELAHLLRRSSSLCLIDVEEQSNIEEQFCNKIAAEILLPEDLLRDLISDMDKKAVGWNISALSRVADKFAVSCEVVLRRLHDLNEITPETYKGRYREIKIKFNENRKVDSEKIMVPHHYIYLNQQGYLFPKVIFSAYANGTISYGELCRTLDVKTSTADKIEQAIMI